MPKLDPTSKEYIRIPSPRKNSQSAHASLKNLNIKSPNLLRVRMELISSIFLYPIQNLQLYCQFSFMVYLTEYKRTNSLRARQLCYERERK